MNLFTFKCKILYANFTPYQTKKLVTQMFVIQILSYRKFGEIKSKAKF